MADLKRRHTFKKWAPDIGENRELPEPALYLELATGLTAEQIKEAMDRLAVVQPEGTTVLEYIRQSFVDALGPYVRVQGGPHTVDGKPLATFEDFVGLVQQSVDFGNRALQELFSAFVEFNRFGGGNDELFSRRRSGGLASTGTKSVVKGSSPTVDP